MALLYQYWMQLDALPALEYSQRRAEGLRAQKDQLMAIISGYKLEDIEILGYELQGTQALNDRLRKDLDHARAELSAIKTAGVLGQLIKENQQYSNQTASLRQKLRSYQSQLALYRQVYPQSSFTTQHLEQQQLRDSLKAMQQQLKQKEGVVEKLMVKIGELEWEVGQCQDGEVGGVGGVGGWRSKAYRKIRKESGCPVSSGNKEMGRIIDQLKRRVKELEAQLQSKQDWNHSQQKVVTTYQFIDPKDLETLSNTLKEMTNGNTKQFPQQPDYNQEYTNAVLHNYQCLQRSYEELARQVDFRARWAKEEQSVRCERMEMIVRQAQRKFEEDSQALRGLYEQEVKGLVQRIRSMEEDREPGIRQVLQFYDQEIIRLARLNCDLQKQVAFLRESKTRAELQLQSLSSHEKVQDSLKQQARNQRQFLIDKLGTIEQQQCSKQAIWQAKEESLLRQIEVLRGMVQPKLTDAPGASHLLAVVNLKNMEIRALQKQLLQVKGDFPQAFYSQALQPNDAQKDDQRDHNAGSPVYPEDEGVEVQAQVEQGWGQVYEEGQAEVQVYGQGQVQGQDDSSEEIDDEEKLDKFGQDYEQEKSPVKEVNDRADAQSQGSQQGKRGRYNTRSYAKQLGKGDG